MNNIPFFEKKNFLNDRDFKLVIEEITKLSDEFTPFYYGETQIYRINLDQRFIDNRSESAILSLIHTRLFDKKMIEEVSANNDLAFMLFSFPHRYTTVISQMREERSYRPHTDMHSGNDWNRNFLSWIYYINDDFNGGELVIETDEGEVTVNPEKNKLVLLPSYRLHKVNKPIYDKGQNFRTTINGFMSI